MRSFVQFVLEPIYKIYSQSLSEEAENVEMMLKELGIDLKRKELRMDSQPLLKVVCREFFGNCNGFVDMCLRHFPNPIVGGVIKVQNFYTGSLDTDVAEAMKDCDPRGPLMINIVKVLISFFCFALCIWKN